ncbi:hypothetical protein PPL_07447 [Heterostelium album PN500]|uniref:Uncharacterized protein n=1 Tax=Heterostelium pallidum (strain ATCC 26659 / Pp 5 / PN500) TaxID=670386 RepID=D3BFZ6_HETP5|nr:hypothetical protein PPL_07447 [Heterostelium album PN500]EFA79756.1 hypothetical protein PPL_07447 [Heterostelium album PN500]|eukprot:XP_020431877.1 hypothetical protein PPL_07447 [Heterostelium album PN500]
MLFLYYLLFKPQIRSIEPLLLLLVISNNNKDNNNNSSLLMTDNVHFGGAAPFENQIVERMLSRSLSSTCDLVDTIYILTF